MLALPSEDGGFGVRVLWAGAHRDMDRARELEREPHMLGDALFVAWIIGCIATAAAFVIWTWAKAWGIAHQHAHGDHTHWAHGKPHSHQAEHGF